MPTRVPDFFIAGAPKAGTTSLYQYLRSRSDIFLPLVKEPHYFTTLDVEVPSSDRARFVRDPDAYARLFEDAEAGQVVGEASSSYLWCPETPYRIRKEVGEARFIVLLRDPMERAYSHYLMDVRNVKQSLPFYEALVKDQAEARKGWHLSHLYVELGLYRDQVKRYIEVFGREKVLVLFFEDLRQDPLAVMEEAVRFLRVDGHPKAKRGAGRKHNEYRRIRGPFAQWILAQQGLRRSIGRVTPRQVRAFARNRLLMRRARRPRMDDRSRSLLRTIFDRENHGLADIIGCDLPWDRRRTGTTGVGPVGAVRDREGSGREL